MSSPNEAEVLTSLLKDLEARVDEEREYLTELDSQIGDADFGANLHRGLIASREAVVELEEPTAVEVVETIGETVVDEIAGSSGILFGMSLMTASAEIEDGINLETVAAFAETYTEEVAERGDVDVGAKTMYDALVPVVDVMNEAVAADRSPESSADRAVEAARRGVMFTSAIRAKRGRASYTGLQSVGHPDPGAVGTYIILQEIRAAVTGTAEKPLTEGLGDRFDLS